MDAADCACGEGQGLCYFFKGELFFIPKGKESTFARRPPGKRLLHLHAQLLPFEYLVRKRLWIRQGLCDAICTVRHGRKQGEGKRTLLTFQINGCISCYGEKPGRERLLSIYAVKMLPRFYKGFLSGILRAVARPEQSHTETVYARRVPLDDLRKGAFVSSDCMLNQDRVISHSTSWYSTLH